MSKAGKFSQQPPATVSSTVVVPSMACDCHGHIFPDAEIYPTVNETMPLAPVEMFLDVHAQLGFQRGVLVQGGAYKFDNRAMLDALDQHPDSLRGVALLPADTSEDELAAYVRRNVRALRFTQGGASRINSFSTIAPVDAGPWPPRRDVHRARELRRAGAGPALCRRAAGSGPLGRPIRSSRRHRTRPHSSGCSTCSPTATSGSS